MKRSIFAIAFVTFVIVAVIFLPFGHTQVAAASGNPTNTIHATSAQRIAAMKFWTHSEIAKTKALPMLIDKSGKPIDNSSVSGSNEALGTPSIHPPAAGNPKAVAAAKKIYASDWKMSADQTPALNADQSAGLNIQKEAGTFRTFDGYPINSWSPAETIYPHVWVGRLSFMDSSSNTYYCSATALSGNTFVTAAHCVYDTTNNLWYNSWVFTPAYRYGYAPYGSFPWTTCTVMTEWQNLSGDYSIVDWTPYDVAVCNVGTNSGGYTLNAEVGHAGWTTGVQFNQHFFDLGYPFQDVYGNNLSYAGAFLYTCVGEGYGQVFPVDVLGMGCNLGPGMSGGPWLIGYQQAAVHGYVDSVNSGYYYNSPSLYGIRFTTSNIGYLCTQRGC